MRPLTDPILVPNREVLTAHAAEMLGTVYEELPQLLHNRHDMLVIRPAPRDVYWFGVVPTPRDGRYQLVELRDDGISVREDSILERRVFECLASIYRDYTVSIEVHRVARERAADRFDADRIAGATGEARQHPASQAEYDA